jgi:hypothetical protein
MEGEEEFVVSERVRVIKRDLGMQIGKVFGVFEVFVFAHPEFLNSLLVSVSR